MAEKNGYEKEGHLDQKVGSEREGSAYEQKVFVVVMDGRINYFEELVE